MKYCNQINLKLCHKDILNYPYLTFLVSHQSINHNIPTPANR